MSTSTLTTACTMLPILTSLAGRRLNLSAVQRVLCLGMAMAAAAAFVPEALAQHGLGSHRFGPPQPSTTFRPGQYQQLPGGNAHYNPTTRSTYLPGKAVVKPSGIYEPRGNGYYQNPTTGAIYNPYTGSYSKGKNLEFRPNNYHDFGGVRLNGTTGSLHVPGVGVIKSSGIYTPIGNGYYRNENTGNVYNPTTGAYKSR